MKVNEMLIKNDVEAQNQTREKLKIVESDTPLAKRILFIGNSITLHERKPEIGWNVNWGMAASAEEKDYVHVVLKNLREKYGDISYAIANVGEWEKNYWDESVLKKFQKVKDFHADTVIVRFGENVCREALDSRPFADFLRIFIDYLTEKAEKVIVTDCFWEYEHVDKALKSVALDKGYDFVKLTDLGYQKENMAIGLFEHPGVAAHPGDLGMQRIAERILEKL